MMRSVCVAAVLLCPCCFSLASFLLLLLLRHFVVSASLLSGTETRAEANMVFNWGCSATSHHLLCRSFVGCYVAVLLACRVARFMFCSAALVSLDRCHCI